MESWQEVDRYFILFAGTAGMAVLCGGLLLIFRAYHKRLIAEQEEKSRLELQYRDELMFANLEAIEKERARLARELHDEVGASISLLRMRARDTQGDTLAIIDGTIDSIRRITYDLQPPTLKAFGITAAIQDYCEQVAEISGLAINLETFDKSLRFGEMTELSVYRILQELVHNTMKHSGASSINIEMGYNGREIYFTYTDNGKGYKPESVTSSGLGLKNIGLRARLCRGIVNYTATEHSHTQVNVNIPIPENT